MSIDTAKPEELTKYTAYYVNDFGDNYSAFLTTDTKISRSVDCEVYIAEDVESELRRLHAELSRLRTIADTDKASADHWRAECEKMRQDNEVVYSQEETDFMEKSLIDAIGKIIGKHHTSPPVQADACKVPQGMKLVPVEPTIEQQEAMVDAYYNTRDVVAAYKAGINAAPQYPADDGPLTDEQVGAIKKAVAPTQAEKSPLDYTEELSKKLWRVDQSVAPTQVETQWQSDLVRAAKALDAMYVRAWDQTNGGLWFSPESVAKFEAAHKKLDKALKAAPSTPPMEPGQDKP